MQSGIPRTVSFKLIHVDPAAINVVHKDIIPVLLRPAVAQVDHGTRMGMPTSFSSWPEISSMGASVAHPMYMICYGFYIFIYIRIEVVSCLPMVPRALNDMEHMWDDTYCSKRMSVVIKINSPGITGAFGKYLKFLFGRMIPPHTCI